MALGRLLSEAGVQITTVAGRRLARARQAARFIGSGKATTLAGSDFAGADVVLITTSDVAIAEVARLLARARRMKDDWVGSVVLHTSGALPATALEPVGRRGAAIGSLHPFQTVPTPELGIRDLPGSAWAIEGDAEARRVARRLVKAMRGHAFRLTPERKVLYHAAAFLACPAVVTLMDQSARLLEMSGVPRGMIRTMLASFVEQTARNFATLGPRRALTGPAVRGDWTTIRRHIAALEQRSPETVSIYKPLVSEMLRLAGRRPPRGLCRIGP